MFLAKDKVLPRVFGKHNKHGAPENALIFGAILQTIFLLAWIKSNIAMSTMNTGTC